MAKGLTTFTIDTDILEAIRSMNINKSELVNDYLRSYLNQPRDTAPAVKKELQKQLEEVEQAKIKVIADESKLKQEIKIVEIKEQQLQEETMVKEQEFKAKQKLCVACGAYFEHGRCQELELDGGIRYIHDSCFLMMENYQKYKQFVKKK